MRDLEHARMMLAMAKKDLNALHGMRSVEAFDEEIFGFHAQQSTEKALKAWLSLTGIQYPKIHDVERLFQLLQDGAQQIPPQFHYLFDLSDFAVQFRYELYDDEGEGEKIEREKVFNLIQEVVRHVERLIQAG